MTKGRQGSYKYFRGSSAGGDLILSGWNLDDKGNDVCGAVITKEGQVYSHHAMIGAGWTDEN